MLDGDLLLVGVGRPDARHRGVRAVRLPGASADVPGRARRPARRARAPTRDGPGPRHRAGVRAADAAVGLARRLPRQPRRAVRGRAHRRRGARDPHRAARTSRRTPADEDQATRWDGAGADGDAADPRRRSGAAGQRARPAGGPRHRRAPDRPHLPRRRPGRCTRRRELTRLLRERGVEVAGTADPEPSPRPSTGRLGRGGRRRRWSTCCGSPCSAATTTSPTRSRCVVARTRTRDGSWTTVPRAFAQVLDTVRRARRGCGLRRRVGAVARRPAHRADADRARPAADRPTPRFGGDVAVAAPGGRGQLGTLDGRLRRDRRPTAGCSARPGRSAT